MDSLRDALAAKAAMADELADAITSIVADAANLTNAQFESLTTVLSKHNALRLGHVNHIDWRVDAEQLAALLAECELFLRVFGLDSPPIAHVAEASRDAIAQHNALKVACSVQVRALKIEESL